MTKDDLIRMADLAGYDVDDDDDVYAPASGRYGLDPRLEHFAQLVADLVRQNERNLRRTKKEWSDYERAIAADEREACARLCENVVSNEGYVQSKWCAAAIRGRTE